MFPNISINHLLRYIYFIIICFEYFFRSLLFRTEWWLFPLEWLCNCHGYWTSCISESPNFTIPYIVLIEKFWDVYNPRDFFEDSDLNFPYYNQNHPSLYLKSLKSFILVNFRGFGGSLEPGVGHFPLKVCLGKLLFFLFC